MLIWQSMHSLLKLTSSVQSFCWSCVALCWGHVYRRCFSPRNRSFWVSEPSESRRKSSYSCHRRKGRRISVEVFTPISTSSPLFALDWHSLRVYLGRPNSRQAGVLEQIARRLWWLPYCKLAPFASMLAQSASVLCRATPYTLRDALHEPE